MKFAIKLAKCFFFQYNSYITKYEKLPKEFIGYTKCFWNFIKAIPEKYEYIPISIKELDRIQKNLSAINLEIIHQLNELPNSEKGTILDENATIKLQIIEKIKNKTSDKKIEPSIAKEFIQVIMSASSGPQNYERFKSILESLDDENNMPNIEDIKESLFSGFSPMQYEFEEVYKDINDFGNELKSVLE